MSQTLGVERAERQDPEACRPVWVFCESVRFTSEPILPEARAWGLFCESVSRFTSEPILSFGLNTSHTFTTSDHEYSGS